MKIPSSPPYELSIGGDPCAYGSDIKKTLSGENMKKLFNTQNIIVFVLIVLIAFAMGYITDRLLLSVIGGVIVGIIIITLWQWIEKESN